MSAAQSGLGIAALSATTRPAPGLLHQEVVIQQPAEWVGTGGRSS